MKYQVQISYTNPAHEHVSLRRRVDTITRLVEASSESEALNRAANQQRALGFMIREAKVIQPDVLAEEVEQIDEAEREAGTLPTHPARAKIIAAIRAKRKENLGKMGKTDKIGFNSKPVIHSDPNEKENA